MENNNKVFKTYSEVNESLEKIESFLNIVETNMNDVKTFGIGVLKFFDEDIRIINEVQAALYWVIDSLKNNTDRQLIDKVKASSGRIYEKMNSINKLITDNILQDTNKWLSIDEPPTQVGYYDCTLIDTYMVNDNPVYWVVNLYYNSDYQEWSYEGDELTKYVKMWFKNN